MTGTVGIGRDAAVVTLPSPLLGGLYAALVLLDVPEPEPAASVGLLHGTGQRPEYSCFYYFTQLK